MPTKHMKNLSSLWANTCNTMWIEIAALRALELQLRNHYATAKPVTPVVDLVYAPECVGRLGDSIAITLPRIPSVMDDLVTTRVVLLAAAFEAYFEDFLDEYLMQRPKYYTNGARTPEGDRVRGTVMKQRGPKRRIDSFATECGAKIASIRPVLDAIEEVYALRNCVAHAAGICDAGTIACAKLIPVALGQRLRIAPESLVTVLADPCFRAARSLDRKIDGSAP